MSQVKRALVLHLANSAGPLLIAIDAADSEDIAGRLPDMVRRGQFEKITAGNGAEVTVNFAHVVVAFMDSPQGLGLQIYGAPERTYGG